MAELVARLGEFAGDTPVVVIYDCGLAEGNVVAVERDEDTEAVTLTVE